MSLNQRICIKGKLKLFMPDRNMASLTQGDLHLLWSTCLGFLPMSSFKKVKS